MFEESTLKLEWVLSFLDDDLEVSAQTLRPMVSAHTHYSGSSNGRAPGSPESAEGVD